MASKILMWILVIVYIVNALCLFYKGGLRVGAISILFAMTTLAIFWE